VWNHPEVSTVLSGNGQHAAGGRKYRHPAEHSQPHNLTADEAAAWWDASKMPIFQTPLPVTACRYCMPCPNGVEIPRVFNF